MRRRTLVVLGVLLLLAVAGLWVFVWSLPEHPINSTNAKRIAAGMAEADVNALLGEKGTPLSFDDDMSLSIYCTVKMQVPVPPGAQLKQWERDGAVLDVLFDRDGRSIGASCMEFEDPDDTIWKKIRRRFGI